MNTEEKVEVEEGKEAKEESQELFRPVSPAPDTWTAADNAQHTFYRMPHLGRKITSLGDRERHSHSELGGPSLTLLIPLWSEQLVDNDVVNINIHFCQLLYQSLCLIE